MLKPERLKKGDKIAVVSLSWGGLGDDMFIHKYDIAKERLERDLGLEVVAMPHALKGNEFVYDHPELRAKDLMDAFADPSIKGIFCAIGGDDSIRLLPYIDYEIIRTNPKIFMGYSDTTVSHFMMNKAGVVSYYGPSVMAEFGEYVSGPRVLPHVEIKANMRKVLSDIQDGTFAGKWIAENKNGRTFFNSKRAQLAKHEMEVVGKKLRDEMLWKNDTDLDSASN